MDLKKLTLGQLVLLGRAVTAFMLAFVVAALPACQASTSAALPRGGVTKPLNVPCPLTQNCNPQYQTFTATQDGNKGIYKWDSVPGDPFAGSVINSSGAMLAKSSSSATSTSTASTVSNTVQFSGYPTVSGTMTLPKPFPIGVKVALNAQISAEIASDGTGTTWWSAGGVNYTAHSNPNSDGTISIAVAGSNGSNYAYTVPVMSGGTSLSGPLTQNCNLAEQQLMATGLVAIAATAFMPPAALGVGILMAAAGLAYAMSGC